MTKGCVVWCVKWSFASSLLLGLLGWVSAQLQATAGLPWAGEERALVEVDALLRRGVEAGAFPGGVALVAHRGELWHLSSVGDAVAFGDERLPMTADTLFDLASLTKLVTAVAVLQLVEQGWVDLDASVARYVREFARPDSNRVSVRHLLAHRSGLPAWAPLYREAKVPEALLEALWNVPLAAAPGAMRRYSDLGYIVLGVLVERVSGMPLERYVEAFIAAPLGLTTLRYNPPAEWRRRVAATEAQPWTGRTLVWGSVHDENAWALGGVAGHAGLFGSAMDVARLMQALLDSVHGREAALLRPETARLLFDQHDPLGFARDASLPLAFGHTGFTGTSVLVDPEFDAVIVLLTNRVHPSRDGPSLTPYRRELAEFAARALAERAAVR
jgi:CubicO group peptidase (beta-lactamase class C family)